MAGGPSTVDLVVAGAAAGALGFLAGGYKTRGRPGGGDGGRPGRRRRHVRRQPLRPGRPDGRSSRGPGRLRLARLEPDAAALGVALGEAPWDDDDYPAKVEAVLAAPPAVVSFTFGIPAVDVIRALQAAGTAVLLTVTTPEEASVALRAATRRAGPAGRRGRRPPGQPGQRRPPGPGPAGAGAPGRRPPAHAGASGRRRWGGRPRGRGRPAGPGGRPGPGRHGLPALPRERRAGSCRRTPSASGAFGRTAVTRAFSGRRARALVNAMVEDHPDAPAAYPEINNATRPLRAAAARAGDPRHMSLYAGTGFAPAPRPVRRPRWSSGCCRECGGER